MDGSVSVAEYVCGNSIVRKYVTSEKNELLCVNFVLFILYTLH